MLIVGWIGRCWISGDHTILVPPQTYGVRTVVSSLSSSSENRQSGRDGDISSRHVHAHRPIKTLTIRRDGEGKDGPASTASLGLRRRKQGL